MKKFIGIIFCLALALGVNAQATQPLTLKVGGTGVDSVNVLNTGSSIIFVRSGGTATTTSVQFVAHKVSGTVAGTVTLMGSVDGVHFKAALVSEASTAIPTFTATDVATQSYTWRINYSPYLYYAISWTGTGTMSAYMRGKLLSH